MDFDLPTDYKPYTDQYFLTCGEVLRKEDINPYVRYQVFEWKPGIVGGIDRAISALLKFSPSFRETGYIWSIKDGDRYESCETIMMITGYLEDIYKLETLYLSILSEETGKANKQSDPDLEKIKETVTEITELIDLSCYSDRPLSNFGARHFGYEWQRDIAKACFDGGASSCSTQAGANTYGIKAVGTTNHAYMIAMAMKHGIENYAVAAMKAFDRHVDPKVPRVFLADTFNREIDDTLKVAEALGNKFWGPRIDTNGAIMPQGGVKIYKEIDNDYLFGNGVTVSGIMALNFTLDAHGLSFVNIGLSSGFSNSEKVNKFIDWEDDYNLKLFDFLGAGFADERYTATSDIMGYWEIKNDFKKFIELHKVGRPIRHNPKLVKRNLNEF